MESEKTFTLDEGKDYTKVPISGSEIDSRIRQESENCYIDIVSRIVNISEKQLTEQRKGKEGFRKFFVIFFCIFISIQFLALLAMVALNAFVTSFSVSDGLLNTYIVAVFVETLGVVAVMVKFAFNTKQEVELLATLNSVVEHFQKFNR